ncbi:hypothetical protein BDQ17DRAFT_1383270 [Cyathus striatus]|nr:hypothetical protein BDQ17DRAFT_1383270 [Cyathus striatus]
MHASLLVYVLALGFYVTLASKQTADKDALNFQLTSSGNENYFYRDNITSAQVLLTSPASNATRRLVAALPAGNNGALVYFLPASTNSGVASEDKLDITLINGTLKSTTSPFHNVGIQADILVTANATLGVTLSDR